MKIPIISLMIMGMQIDIKKDKITWAKPKNFDNRKIRMWNKRK